MDSKTEVEKMIDQTIMHEKIAIEDSNLPFLVIRLRDEFARLAMVELIRLDVVYEEIPAISYKIADGMIATRLMYQ